MPPSVLHLSTYDMNGGAARAAYALHQSMTRSGLNSTLRVAHKWGEDPTVLAPEGMQAIRTRAAQLLDGQVRRLQRSTNAAWRSPAVFGALSAREINASKADVVNLHWVTDGYLSVAQIGRITKPVVWSLVDMWPFSGTEHYGDDTLQARWRNGYTSANRPVADRGLDLDRMTWQRKRRSWRRPMHIVVASSWMKDRVAASALLGDWPVTQIPHVVDGEAFAPAEPQAARSALGLPIDRPLIGFLSSGGIGDGRKGWDLLEAALPAVKEQHPDVAVVVVGPASPDHRSAAGVPIFWQGLISGDSALSAFYSAVDVMAVPSREDNMPLAAMEAQTSGRPVVAFRIGGLPDIVDHEASGYLAEPFDVRDLATGLSRAIDDSQRERNWSTGARSRSATWSPGEVVRRYAELYGQIVE